MEKEISIITKILLFFLFIGVFSFMNGWTVPGSISILLAVLCILRLLGIYQKQENDLKRKQFK